MTATTPVVWHLGPRSAALAERLATSLGAADILRSQSQELQTPFATGRPTLAIAAAGIVVRLLAPHLADKSQDPPVLVVDETTRFVACCPAGSRP